MQMKYMLSGAIIMRKNDHITDLDAIELSSGWNYNDKITLSDEIHVNGNKYKVIKDQKPTNTGLGYKLYERYDNDRSTGKLIISLMVLTLVT